MCVRDLEDDTQVSRMELLKQQELKAWQPVLTPVAVIGLLLVVAMIFMPIGIVLLDASSSIVEQKYRYDNIDNCSVDDTMNYEILPKTCTITFTIEKTMNPPIYFYYELHNFYQNHRRYISSKSDDQLRGESNPSLSKCTPTKSYNGSTLYACGLVSGSFFEDRFSMTVNDIELCNSTSNCHNFGMNNASEWKLHWADWHEEPNWSMLDIAWSSDKEKKFLYHNYSDVSRVGYRQNISGLNLPDVTNEDFIVWMRVASLPNFRKLHRKIKSLTLNQGDNVTVTILNWYPVSTFDGKKYIVLTTTEWAGGKNYLLAWTYIVVSCVCIVLAIIFAVLLLFGKRKLADVDAFQWHNRPKAATVATVAS